MSEGCLRIVFQDGEIVFCEDCYAAHIWGPYREYLDWEFSSVVDDLKSKGARFTVFRVSD